MENISIGIDLGTTYSCVGVYKNQRVEIIANEHGNRTTPSYVSFDNDIRKIGEDAKDDLTINPTNTIYDSKRLIGRRYDDDTVQNDLHNYSYIIVDNGKNKPVIEVEYLGETKQFNPEQISSMILEKMKHIAETYVGCDIKDAVITVPAYFNDAQRSATSDAGIIAGLNVLRIINEPTAAAIAYSLDQNLTNETKILIYDLGGGTLDVTVLTVENKNLEVESTAGDTHLGGEDFDLRMSNYCLNEFVKKICRMTVKLTHVEMLNLLSKYEFSNQYELYQCDIELLENDLTLNENETCFIHELIKLRTVMDKISDNVKSMGKLKRACENAKKTLSNTHSTNISVDTFYIDENGKQYDLRIPMSRDIFNEICKEEFDKCMEPVDQALRDSKLKYDNIDHVVLIGGSTRIPKIKELLIEKFGNKLKCDINPDEAVAYGASIYAAKLSGINNEELNSLILCDVIPLSIGIETAGGIMVPLIKKNTRIPVTKTEYFTTHSDNQPCVTVKIFEGERALTKDNHFLGKFDLMGISPMLRGQPKIKVDISINENGIIKIDASEENSNVSKTVAIKSETGRFTDAELSKMIEDAEKFHHADEEIRKTSESKISLENYISTMKNTLNDEKFNQYVGDKLCIKLNEKISNFADKIENENLSREQYSSIRKQIEDIMFPLLEEFTIKQNEKK